MKHCSNPRLGYKYACCSTHNFGVSVNKIDLRYKCHRFKCTNSRIHKTQFCEKHTKVLTCKYCKNLRTIGSKFCTKHLQIRSNNVVVFKDTLTKLKNYVSITTSSKHTNTYQLVQNLQPSNTYVQIYNIDCVQLIIDKVKLGKKIACLNMANSNKYGGGVEKGATAQEEHLCRVSNLYNTLSTVEYPLHEFEVVYSENVLFIKDQGYNDVAPYTCDIISCAGYDLSKGGEFSDVHRHGTEKKIKNILATCIEKDVKIIILSALGCGAFKNPPDIVANIFYNVLVKQGYKNYFDEVIFSITGENYNIFKNIFDQVTGISSCDNSITSSTGSHISSIIPSNVNYNNNFEVGQNIPIIIVYKFIAFVNFYVFIFINFFRR
jgi:uncharacterized protein (TIGR02452 family)